MEGADFAASQLAMVRQAMVLALAAVCAFVTPLFSFVAPKALPAPRSTFLRGGDAGPSKGVPIISSGAFASPEGASSTVQLAGLTGVTFMLVALATSGRARGRSSGTSSSSCVDGVQRQAVPAKQDEARPSTAGPPPVPPKEKKPKFEPAMQLGIYELLGFFDPLGFSKVGDRKGFLTNRDYEIKHGRIAMLAFTGLIVQHFIHVDVPPLQALLTTNVNSLGAIRVFYGPIGFFGLGPLFVGFFAYFEFGWAGGNKQKEPGNYGDPFGFGMYDDGMRNNELTSGRLAMFGVVMTFLIELMSGKDIVEQLTFPLTLLGLGGGEAATPPPPPM